VPYDASLHIGSFSSNSAAPDRGGHSDGREGCTSALAPILGGKLSSLRLYIPRSPSGVNRYLNRDQSLKPRYVPKMGFGIFIHRSDSIYDDSPAEQYQFPSQYLRRVEACVGDWIVYYEPRKVPETRGYFAVAKVSQVIRDPATEGMYIAVIEPGSYLDFINPVPFSGPDGLIERGILSEGGRISGRAQSAVRPLSPEDFHRILERGLADAEPPLPRLDSAIAPVGLHEDKSPFLFEQDRERVSSLTSRIVRDRVFRRIVLRA
jgi:putative restriction endonuclease